MVIYIFSRCNARACFLVPVNVLRYLPVIPRIQCLYMMEEIARQMTWHKYGKRTEFGADGKPMLTHPSDGLAWKHFDEKHSEKAKEPRHCRIAVGTDGFNPFGLLAASYSFWPVFFMPLNLPPPSEIMKRKNIFLTLIIPRPKYPGKNTAA